jgi:ABC-type ATPase with predicted acetyltransferase domain
MNESVRGESGSGSRFTVFVQIWIRIQICNVTASQPRPLTYPASVATMHLAGVTKSFGDRTLLDDVSLRVSTGQRLCLVGRNGVGKTTLLRIIAGEMAPDSGEVGIPRGFGAFPTLLDVGHARAVGGDGEGGRSAKGEVIVDVDLVGAGEILAEGWGRA